MEIEEVNSTCYESDILVLDDVRTHVGVNMVFHPSHTWLLDSDASFHVTPHIEWFTCYEAKSLEKVRFGDSHQCGVIDIGDTSMHFSDGSHLTIKNVRHVPQLTRSLVSVGQLDDNG